MGHGGNHCLTLHFMFAGCSQAVVNCTVRQTTSLPPSPGGQRGSILLSVQFHSRSIYPLMLHHNEAAHHDREEHEGHTEMNKYGNERKEHSGSECTA